MPKGKRTVNQRGTDQQMIAAAAAMVGINPAILWGVYGVETSFGADVSNSGSGPSGGAKGYMQFEDATAKQYGVNVHDKMSSFVGAARYLRDLGVNHDVNRALNGYNGNGQGSGESTYSRNVKRNANTWTGGGGKIGASTSGTVVAQGAVTTSGGVGGAIDTVTGDIAGVAGDAASVVGDFILGPINTVEDFFKFITDPTNLGGLVIDAAMWALRLSAKAFWKYVLGPPVHKSERATVYYWDEIMSGKHFGTSGDPYQWAVPATLTFWSLGAYLLWGKSEQRSPLAPAQSTPLGKTARRASQVAGKRKLHAPREATKHTPPKPKPTTSHAKIDEVRLVSVARKRPVTVSEGGKHLGSGKTTSSQEPVEQVGTASVNGKENGKPKPTEPGKSGGSAQGSRRSHAKEVAGSSKREST